MNVTFVPVKTEDQIVALAKLADEIWHEFWVSRIGAAQTDYMVEKFQSVDAIRRDMDTADYEYWFIAVDDSEDAKDTSVESNGDPIPTRIIGYTGGHPEPETNRFFISKIYLLAGQRGHGFASKTVDFYEKLCRANKFDAMYLTVNKDNDVAIPVYLKLGFKTIDASVTDIGGGFVMDDYIMEKEVPRQ